jgi:hypothetical protein
MTLLTKQTDEDGEGEHLSYYYEYHLLHYITSKVVVEAQIIIEVISRQGLYELIHHLARFGKSNWFFHLNDPLRTACRVKIITVTMIRKNKYLEALADWFIRRFKGVGGSLMAANHCFVNRYIGRRNI